MEEETNDDTNIIEIKTEEKLVASFAAAKEPPISCKQETITNTHAYIQTHTITHTLIQIYVKYIKKSSIWNFWYILVHTIYRTLISFHLIYYSVTPLHSAGESGISLIHFLRDVYSMTTKTCLVHTNSHAPAGYKH